MITVEHRADEPTIGCSPAGLKGETTMAHVNSGPTSHSNVPGHANFTVIMADPAGRMDPAKIERIERGLSQNVLAENVAASHVNSGPTSHSNVPGHANFTKSFADPAGRLESTQVSHFENSLKAGARVASHVNSGPTSHSNVPGHANFTKVMTDSANRLDPTRVGGGGKAVKGD